MYSSFLLNPDSYRNPIQKMPILFRGGIDNGDIYERVVPSIIQSKIQSRINLIGEPLVKAVRLEQNKSFQGPRLFCTQRFYNNLSGAFISKYVDMLDDDTYEIYWTTFSVFKEENLPEQDRFGAFELLEIIKTLKNHYNNEPALRDKYIEFHDSAKRGILKYCEFKNYEIMEFLTEMERAQ